MAKPYPKPKAGRRTVPLPLPDQLIRRLLLHRSLYLADEGGPVFRDARGGALRQTNFLPPAGVTAGPAEGGAAGRADVSRPAALLRDLADLRQGAGQRRAAIEGHEQASTTLNRYTRTLSGYADRVRLVVGDVAADPPPVAGRHDGVGPEAGP